MNNLKYLLILISGSVFSMGSKNLCDRVKELPWCKVELPPGPGPTSPCEATPDSKECACEKEPEGLTCKPCVPGDTRQVCDPVLEPIPKNQTRRAQFLRDNASRSSHVFFSSRVDDAFRDEYISFSKNSGHNEIYIYANNGGDYGGKSLEYKTELKDQWRSWMKKMQANGLQVVLWLFADDSNFGKLSDAEIERRTKLVHADLGDLVKTYVPFLEINEAMDEGRAQKTVNMVKSVTGKEVGCHTGSISTMNHCKTADLYFLQVGFGMKESDVVKLVKDAIARKGKCKVVLAEYNKSGDVRMGDAGIKAGAIGCGNGCSITELPAECRGEVVVDPIPTPDPVPPSDFDWSRVKKYGGPEIGLAKDVGSWTITSQLRSVSFKGSNLTQDRDSFRPQPCTGGDKPLQGTFNACVEQEDKMFICGSWDYERCGGQQGGKTLGNLEAGGTMAQSFGLKKGSKICFFNSGLARTNQRNQNVRTSTACTTWPH